MKQIIIFLCVIVMVSVVACQNSQKMKPVKVPVNNAMTKEVFNPEKNGYKLVWVDNFDGTELDTTIRQQRKYIYLLSTQGQMYENLPTIPPIH